MSLGKNKIIWGIAFAYLVYAAVGDIPQLSGYQEFSIVASSGLFIVVYFIHSYINLGVKSATKYFVVAAALGYGFEYLFISTGWVGHYVYTADLSPLLGPIPAFIPLLWASLGYFCLIASDNIVTSALLMMLLDVAFDPRFSVTLWTWVPPGQYFGVPLSNFVGWFVTALAIFGVFYLVTRHKIKPTLPAIAFYLMFGLVNGAIPDLSPGLYEAGEISVVIFLAAAGFLYLRYRRVANAGPGPSPGSPLPDSQSTA